MSQHLTSDLRLPSYKMSYLLRFHPYPRVKLSNREIMMQTINDRLSSTSTQYDVAEGEGTTGFDPLIFSDLEEEQHLNAVNLQEAIEVAEAGAQPRVRHRSLIILVIFVSAHYSVSRRQDLAVLVTRKLSLKTKTK
ncbi:hypothetical protein K503DRAFT_779774 [Rhizopogon vinicolor AM-OR11-026]|uniref:Uncharacterized protein n=1 Tax=Rhizopogon vinicolor AM-OR11-026 TaxID=1314800 RepID=A0A1B7NCW8_9AGAM|nr:hypothetical protein K503DRAFT_779774 [Rhizopogon vinicolor AM-OR11-026]